MKNKRTIALIGNPNCGKTTLFNALTGSHQKVGNWPGITVEKKTGQFRIGSTAIEVIDLPGTYVFESKQEGTSQDELVVRNFLKNDDTSLLVNIIDASNLQKSLYLTFQLLDLARPMIVVLNMIDVAEMEGYQIYISLLQEKLGCPVVAMCASKKKGIDELKQMILNFEMDSYVPSKLATLSPKIEHEITEIIRLLPPDSVLHHLNRWQLLELLYGNDIPELSLIDHDKGHLRYGYARISGFADGEFDIAIASSRYEEIDALVKEVVKTTGVASNSLTNKIDQWALGRFSGVPIFLGIMFLMFMFSINIGSSFIDFFEIFFGAIFIEGSEALLSTINAPEWLIAFLAHGIGAGITTVATFIPVLASMFFCLSFLEDSGYLARAAMVVDRGMRALGLPGKAFVPMLVGFGCNIPAIMGTRTLESERDRLMSIMMIPFMSCGARLPVYALFAAIFFPTNGGIVVYFLYLLGIAIAILTGYLLKLSVLKGSLTPFIMELPAYHIPTFKGLILLTWERLKGFIYRAGKAIIIVVACLGILNSWGTDGSFGNQDSEQSVLSSIGKSITPVFTPMGLTEENWPATVGIFTGIFAKEAVIGTLNSLYSQMDSQDKEDEDKATYNLWSSIKEALATIPENLAELPSQFFDPMGISRTMAKGDIEEVKEANEIDDLTVSFVEKLFPSTAAVLAYLIFILLYTPCVAALGSVYREAGIKWTLLVAIWTFVIGWITATAFYQSSLLGSAQHHSALIWLIVLSLALVGILGIFYLMGKYNFLASSYAVVSKSHLNNENQSGCC